MVCTLLYYPLISLGVDIDTEKLYYYKSNWSLSQRKDLPEVKGHIVRNGIVYETKDTPQIFRKEKGKAEFSRSGDGTVTYESLSYPNISWKDSLELKVEELRQVEHRSIICTELFFDILVPYICKNTLLEKNK